MKSLVCEQRATRTEDGSDLAYQSLGSGPAVLFCTGLGAGWHGFAPQLAHFSSRCHCLAWNYRGLFRDRPPAAPPLHVTDHAADAAAILERESAGPVAVVGWSFGVLVALELFARAPGRVSSLVLINGGACASWSEAAGPGPIRRRYGRLFALLSRAPELLELLVRQAASSPETLTWARRLGIVAKGLDPELLGEVLRNLRGVDAAALLGTLAHMAELDLRPMLGQVDVPTLVLGGDRDPFTSRKSLEQLVNGVRGAEFLLVPGGTHFVQLDHPQLVNLRIQKFWSERGLV